MGSTGRDGWCWMCGMSKVKDEGGLMRDEILVAHGEDFTGETVRVLKEREIKQFGEYPTRRLVLEAWDALDSKKAYGVSA